MGFRRDRNYSCRRDHEKFPETMVFALDLGGFGRDSSLSKRVWVKARRWEQATERGQRVG